MKFFLETKFIAFYLYFFVYFSKVAFQHLCIKIVLKQIILISTIAQKVLNMERSVKRRPPKFKTQKLFFNTCPKHKKRPISLIFFTISFLFLFTYRIKSQHYRP